VKRIFCLFVIRVKELFKIFAMESCSSDSNSKLDRGFVFPEYGCEETEVSLSALFLAVGEPLSTEIFRMFLEALLGLEPVDRSTVFRVIDCEALGEHRDRVLRTLINAGRDRMAEIEKILPDRRVEDKDLVERQILNLNELSENDFGLTRALSRFIWVFGKKALGVRNDLRTAAMKKDSA